MSDEITTLPASLTIASRAFGRVVQFPSLGEVLESEELSRALLEVARWPHGPECLNCKTLGAACRLTTRPGLWTCKACRRCQYSVTSGTPLHGTRVSLTSWVVLLHIQEVRRQRPSISQVSRKLGVSYLTAKSMLLRLDELRATMPAMSERIRSQLLDLSLGRAPSQPEQIPATPLIRG